MVHSTWSGGYEEKFRERNGVSDVSVVLFHCRLARAHSGESFSAVTIRLFGLVFSRVMIYGSIV